MPSLTFDHFVVGIFLLVTLVVGLRSGKNITNIRRYAIADKMYGTGTLVLTYMATNFAGASLINGVAQVFSNGIIMTVALSGLIIGYILEAFFIIPKAATFGHCLTMGDLMAHFYDKRSKVIAGILGLLTTICIASMEMIVLGIIFESLLGVPASWGVVIGGATLAIYSARGGIQAVTTTDILQFLVLIVVIPITATIAVGHAGGLQALFEKVPSANFHVLNHERFSYYLTLFLMLSIFPAGLIDPAIIQRLLMARDSSQLTRQYLVTAALRPALESVIMLIGLAGIVLYPQLEATQVFPHIVQDLLPTGIRGLVIAGALAVSMSTIDSYLHAAGLTFTHDVLKPLCDSRKIAIDELAWAKYSTLALGLMAVLVGVLGAGSNTDDILEFALTSLEFTGPLLMFPLLTGIMGLKTDVRSFYTALPVTLAAFALSNIYLSPEQDHLSLLISILANGVAFFGMHIWQNKGFAVVHRTQNARIENVWGSQEAPWHHRIRDYLPTLTNIVRYSQQKVAQYGAPYLLFGVFCCVNFIVPYFMWTQTAHEAYGLMLPLRLVGATLCGLLLVNAQWPSMFRPYAPVFWHFTVLYCLPFMGTVMLLLTHGSTEWLMNVAMTILFLVLLVDWTTFVLLSVLGVVLGIFFYTSVVGPASISLDFTNVYLLVYQAFFATLIGLIFARRKEQNLAEQLLNFRILGDTTSQEARYALHSLRNIMLSVDVHIGTYMQLTQTKQHDKKPEKVRIEVTSEDVEYMNSLTQAALEIVSQGELAIDMLHEAFKINVIVPQLKSCSVQKSVEKAIQACFFHHEPDELQADLSLDFEAYISPTHFEYVVLNLLRYLCVYDERRLIQINLVDNEVRIKTYGIRLPPAAAKELFAFTPVQVHEERANFSLGICKLIIETMEGRILCESATEEGTPYTAFKLTLPTTPPQSQA
ncbi:MAG: hypothetical protein ROO73_05650 [Roseivirga sp.]